jgi:hypothetical protein
MSKIREGPWEARIRFSFVEDGDFAVLDIDPEENEPSAAVMRSVLRALADQTDLLRRRWWETFATVALDGKWVRDLPRQEGQPQFEVLDGAWKGAARIKGVKFNPATGRLSFSLEGGGAFEADVGQGRDLSDKD